MKHPLYRKLVATIAAIFLLFSLCACAPKTEDPSSNGSAMDTEQQTDVTSSDDSQFSEPSDTEYSQTDETEESSPADSEEHSTDEEGETSSTSSSPSAQGSTSTTSTTSQTPSQNTTDTDQSVSVPTPTPVKGFTPVSPDQYYGRTWLKTQTNGANLVKVYDLLVREMENFAETVDVASVATVTVDEMYTAWLCYQADYARHFWVEQQYDYTHQGNKVVSITPYYYITKAQYPQYKQAFDNAVSQYLSGLNGSMDPYDLELALHDRIIQKCAYRSTALEHTAYGALVEGAAVCDGFAKGFQTLCLAVGIPCTEVQGSAVSGGESQNHAWNLTKIDGEWYYTDVTWDNGTDTAQDWTSYRYFNLTSASMGQDHTIDSEMTQFALPACNKTTANYFYKNHTYLTSLSVQNLSDGFVRDNTGIHCHALVDCNTDINLWLEQNYEAIASALGLSSYSVSWFIAEHEIYVLYQ